MQLTRTPLSCIRPRAGVAGTLRRISFFRLWFRSGIRNGPTAPVGRAVTGTTPLFWLLRAARLCPRRHTPGCTLGGGRSRQT